MLDVVVKPKTIAAPPSFHRFMTIQQAAANEREAMDLARKTYLHEETTKLIHDHHQLMDILLELLDSEATAPLVGLTLRDAITEVDKSWDGISALADLIHSRARARVAEAWASKLMAEAPECRDCDYSKAMRDPYGTGDSPTQYDCQAGACPWGK